MFVAMVVLTVLCALLYRGGPGLFEGARFGALIALFLHAYLSCTTMLTSTLKLH